MLPDIAETDFISYLILTAAGYLLGSVHFCRWVPLLFRNIDICRESEDGNPGAANVFVLCGWPMGLFCLFCDMAKGFLPVFAVVKWLDAGSLLFIPVMVAPALGHAFSVFARFGGGKCISVIFGEMIALLWLTPVGLVLAGLYIFFSVAVKIDPHSRRSIVTFGFFLPVALGMEIMLGQIPIGAGCACLSVLAILKHLRNPNRTRS